MSSKKTKTAAKPSTTDPIDPAVIDNAISTGQAILGEGKPKIEAAMAIYTMLEAVDQQTVVATLIKGANLTPMGATTYWYNCKRKLAKQRKHQSI
ncbi:MAG: hypothetical protein LCH39_07950 [Proteobacteria bacterium]|nr:hypothetical protein [Pseudomonadota bacterium]